MPFRPRHALAVASLLLSVAALAVASTADAASPVEAAITRTAESLGRQIGADYDHASSRRRELPPGSKWLIASYKAKDLTNHRMGHYVLVAEFSTATHRVTSVSITEQAGLQERAPLAEFAISQTAGNAWEVSFVTDQPHSHFLATYQYVTGGPLARLPESHRPTLHDFRLLAALGQTMLTNARAGAPINYVPLPYPPPGGASTSALATSASATTSPTVYLDQPGLSQAIQPSAFAVAEYNDPHDPNTLAESRIVSARWSGWGEATATATGEAHVQWADASTGPQNLQMVTLPVLITASGLHNCGGISIYTSLVINPAPGATAPPHFAQVQRDDKVTACAVHARSYVAGQEERTDPNGCFFKGLRELVIRPPFSLGYCAMRWKNWGSSTTTGEGVARIGYKQYGLRVRLSRVRWCRQWTVSYTQEIAEVWGAGEALTGIGNVSSGQAARLRAGIGRSGQGHRVVREAMPGGVGCVG